MTDKINHNGNDDNLVESDDVKDNDIVFDCKHCGHSFVIDKTGAGITLTCPECQNDIIVPSTQPEAEFSDMVETDEPPPLEGPSREEALSRIAQLENELALKSEQIKTLMTELEELRFRRNYLEKARLENSRMFLSISSQISVLQSSIEQLDDILKTTDQDAAETQVIA